MLKILKNIKEIEQLGKHWKMGLLPFLLILLIISFYSETDSLSVGFTSCVFKIPQINCISFFSISRTIKRFYQFKWFLNGI